MTKPVEAMVLDLSHALHERLNEHDRNLLADLEIMQRALTIRVTSGMNGAEVHALLNRLSQSIIEGIVARGKHVRTHDMLDKMATRMDWPTNCPERATGDVEMVSEIEA